MAIEPAITPYTTRAEIAAIFSDLAVVLRIDDDEDLLVSTTENSYLDSVLEEATDVVNDYALHRYTAEVLETSRWVRRKASYIAAHLLSRRCGNPAQFSVEYDEAIHKLRLVREGTFFIPRIAPDMQYEPTVSNQVVDYRHRRSKLRTDTHTSTGGTNGQFQPLDYAPAGAFW